MYNHTRQSLARLYTALVYVAFIFNIIVITSDVSNVVEKAATKEYFTTFYHTVFKKLTVSDTNIVVYVPIRTQPVYCSALKVRIYYNINVLLVYIISTT